MNPQQVKRNILLYKLYQAFKEPLFWGPILIIYIQKIGNMSLPQIYLMESVCVILLFILQIPTGALADKIGRKKTMLIGSVLLVVDCLVFGLARGPAWIWMANIFWSFGFSLISGADSALLYDTLASQGKSDSYKQVDGKSIANRFILFAIASPIAGYLAATNMRLPVLLGLPGLLATCVFIMCMVEPPRTGDAMAKKRIQDIMKLSVIFVANNKRVKWIIAYTALLLVIGKVWFFTYNPYFELVALPLKYYGWIFFVLNIVAAIFSYFAHQIAKRSSPLACFTVMVLITALPIMLMGALPLLPLVWLVLFQNVTRGYLRPFMGQYLNDHLKSEHRATVSSVQSAVDALAQFVLLGVFGLILKVVNLPIALIMLGTGTLFVGLILLVRYQKIFKPQTG
jgi:MFS family permease